MFRNQSNRSANESRVRISPKTAVLLISLALLLLAAVGGTIAYIVTQSGPVENTFTPGTVDVTINEKFEKQVKENVNVGNTGDVPVYVRAMLVINWIDAEGNIVLTVPEGYSYTMTGLAADGSGWTKASDGYYYYKDPVAAGSATNNLLDKCEAVTPANAEYFLQVDVLTEVIQADPTDAVEETWGVTVAADGTISKQ